MLLSIITLETLALQHSPRELPLPLVIRKFYRMTHTMMHILDSDQQVNMNGQLGQ